jgi:hypothetical protein
VGRFGLTLKTAKALFIRLIFVVFVLLVVIMILAYKHIMKVSTLALSMTIGQEKSVVLEFHTTLGHLP